MKETDDPMLQNNKQVKEVKYASHYGHLYFTCMNFQVPLKINLTSPKLLGRFICALVCYKEIMLGLGSSKILDRLMINDQVFCCL